MENSAYIFLDHTATIAAMEQFCREAKEKNAASVCIPPLFIKTAKDALAGTNIKISTVIAYPFGWAAIESKVAEVILAMIDGADELDIVINMIALKNNDWQYLARELNTLLTVVRKQQQQIGFIMEAGLLTKDEITKCCDLYGAAGIDCLHIFPAEMVPAETVAIIRRQLADKIAIQISGSNISREQEAIYRQAGATGIGHIVK